MSNDYKSKLLALHNILIQKTDENHSISMQDILFYMEMEGCSCSDDSIRRYIRQLQEQLDLDVISTQGRNAQYYIGTKLLEIEEMKLIVDSINASNFIEKSVADKMIGKLKSTMSEHEVKELDRSVLGVNIAKADNKKILINVNLIQEALKKDIQISFDYMYWNKNKKLVKKREKKYIMNPWALIWANDRYYLFCYKKMNDNVGLKECVYRVDKLDNIELIDKRREGREKFRSFNASTYVSRHMGMFTGEEKTITVRVTENLIGAFIDQYGKRIQIEEELEGKFLITFNACPSDLLLGWLIGLKDVEVVYPDSVKTNIKELIKYNMDKY